MARRPVVVDGSNLATEGRSMPSLAQLDEAVRAWLAENPDDEVIVVVDASFSYRIDESERKMFEEAEDAGEVVSPPAGAVGRGDGFLLRIADRVDAAVLSNDSFQEFHGEYKWLFDTGRLLGGKPVPNVGWIFTPRTPVRGPKSRMAVRDAQKATKGSRSAPVVKAIAQATAEAIEAPPPTEARRPRRRSGRSAEAAPVASHEAVNEPLPFVTFIANHPLGTEIEGTVVSFTSHGAFVEADGARCYVPVVGLGDPPPRTAKAVLKAGEVRTFVVQALDPPRRGIELALPEVARVAGAPTDETVEADIASNAARRPTPQRSVAGIPPPPRGRRSPIAGAARARGDGVGSADDVTTEEPAGADQPAVSAAEFDTMAPIAPDEAVPKRPRSPRRRRSAATTTADAPVPAPAPRAPRSTRKATAAAIAAPADDAAAAAPETTARRARRATRKSAPVEADTLPPVDAGTLLDVTTEKAPARTLRAGKRAVGPAGDDTPAAIPGDPAAEPTGSRSPAKKAAAKKAPAKKAAAKKAAAKKAVTKKAPAKKAPAKKAAPAREAAATKTAATKSVAATGAAVEAAPASRAPRSRATKAATDPGGEPAAAGPPATPGSARTRRRRAI
ncbi:MAG TPA: S1 RNA-binding domain-containing protein [Acidimicrobiales bacterium]|nr:S1 RNA-binding domain-containing protein [Acidimicrobiales bacterium]